MIDFTRIDYLKTGTARQKHAHEVLSHHQILQKLSKFDPVLAGTIPINIDIDSSDLDIICCFSNPEDFQTCLITAFGQEQDFIIFSPKKPGAIAATFSLGEFEIEIFGQSIPTVAQAAYLHMLIESKILEEKGEVFRKQIVELKKQGYKTEPAFGKLLGIEGNVYEELLKWKP